MSFPKRPTNKEAVYADYDEDTGMYCVFGLNSGFAYHSYASEQEAKQKVMELNK